MRSQVQIALAVEAATGRRISAVEALDTYGFENLLKVALEGSAIIVDDREEPARTLRERRETLNLDIASVARASGLTSMEVEAIETPGRMNSVRKIEMLAQVLALDERLVGFQPAAGGDLELGVRLREMAQQRDTFVFSTSTVLKLAEGAWAVARQNELAKSLGLASDILANRRLQSTDYSYPAYQRGYELASRTRTLLGIGVREPIRSLRALIERDLGVPLVQETLDDRFAGATIANGQARGIVVNERGRNQNVWVRRMTLAHELGHLFGDPDSRLNRLRVDEYDGIEADARTRHDAVEMRANGFAVAFLAPPEAMQDIATSERTGAKILCRVMGEFGISRTAANYHIKNTTGIDVSAVPSADVYVSPDDWIAGENLTIDYFPIDSTPISRRGLFSYLVTRAADRSLISVDTAASWLKTTCEGFESGRKRIIQLND